MLEKYESAIDKIRRIDDLKDELKSLKGEDGKLSSSAVVYRKKNDWREKNANDAAIKDINDRRYAISKREALIRAEIKSLRAEVYDILSECFAEALTEEHRAKIREACLYASDGAALISQAGRTPAAFGKCKIVGKRVTHDEKLGGKVEKLIRAGVRNTSGKFLILPEIVIYDYDETAVEGEYTAVIEYYPSNKRNAEVYTPVKGEETESGNTQDVKKRSGGNDAMNVVRGKFVSRASLVALVAALLFFGFYLWATVSKIAVGSFKTKIARFAVAYFLISLFVTVASNAKKKIVVTDGTFPLFSLYAGALSAFTLVFSDIPTYSFALPLSMLLGGIIGLALIPSASGESRNPAAGVLLSAAVGACLGFAVSGLYLSGVTIFVYAVLGCVTVAGLAFSIVVCTVKNVAAIENLGYCLIGIITVCAVCAFMLGWKIAVGAGACALVFALAFIGSKNRV